MWFCENCGNKLHEDFTEVTDIVTQLPVIMGNFWDDEEKRTCDKCGDVLQPPVKQN